MTKTNISLFLFIIFTLNFQKASAQYQHLFSENEAGAFRMLDSLKAKRISITQFHFFPTGTETIFNILDFDKLGRVVKYCRWDSSSTGRSDTDSVTYTYDDKGSVIGYIEYYPGGRYGTSISDLQMGADSVHSEYSWRENDDPEEKVVTASAYNIDSCFKKGDTLFCQSNYYREGVYNNMLQKSYVKKLIGFTENIGYSKMYPEKITGFTIKYTEHDVWRRVTKIWYESWPHYDWKIAADSLGLYLPNLAKAKIFEKEFYKNYPDKKVTAAIKKYKRGNKNYEEAGLKYALNLPEAPLELFYSDIISRYLMQHRDKLVSFGKQLWTYNEENLATKKMIAGNTDMEWRYFYDQYGKLISIDHDEIPAMHSSRRAITYNGKGLPSKIEELGLMGASLRITYDYEFYPADK